MSSRNSTKQDTEIVGPGFHGSQGFSWVTTFHYPAPKDPVQVKSSQRYASAREARISAEQYITDQQNRQK